MKSKIYILFVLATLIVTSTILTGCATTDPENISSRPWNAPQGWSGLPSGINEGR
jgi:hypothetical protein